MKRSYYKLALQYHPDRVASNEKEEAKEKFNIIHNAYSILTDASKKKLYDNGCNVLFTKATIAAHWEKHLKPVKSDDIYCARRTYQGSILERNDIIREIVVGKGSMVYLLNHLPFMRREDENRIIEITRDLMDKGVIPKMSIRKIR